jgi:hypothetical protein
VTGDEWAAAFDPRGRLREDHGAGDNLDWFDTKREAVAYCENAEIVSRASEVANEKVVAKTGTSIHMLRYDWGTEMMKVIATLMAAIATGMVYAAPAYGSSRPADPVVCVTPPGGAPVDTPECNACIQRHLFDRDGLLRECLGGNPNPN